jgi:hypothetical protein
MGAGFPDAKRPVQQRARTRRASDLPTPHERRTNLVVVAWVVTCACAYLGFSVPQPWAVESLVLLAVGSMVVGNVVIGRVDPRRLTSPMFSIGVAVVYTGLLLAVWQLGGQGSVELLVAAVALLDLALVGLSAGELAAIGLAMFLVYAVIL